MRKYILEENKFDFDVFDVDIDPNNHKIVIYVSGSQYFKDKDINFKVDYIYNIDNLNFYKSGRTYVPYGETYVPLNDGDIDVEGTIEVLKDYLNFSFLPEDELYTEQDSGLTDKEAADIYNISLDEIKQFKTAAIEFSRDYIEQYLNDELLDNYENVIGDVDIYIESLNKSKKKKSALPFYNPNSGDSEKGNKFFNKVSGEVPTSSPDGTVGAVSMGESVENKTFKVHYLQFKNSRSDDYNSVDTTVEANSKEEAYQKVRKMLMQNKIVYRDLYIY